MSVMSIFLSVALWGAPLWITAIWAIRLSLSSAQSDSLLFFFQNRASGIGILLFVTVIIAVFCLMTIERIGGCTGGFIDPIDCVRFSDQFGAAVDRTIFNILPIISLVGIPSLVLYLVAEGITRWKS